MISVCACEHVPIKTSKTRLLCTFRMYIKIYCFHFFYPFCIQLLPCTLTLLITLNNSMHFTKKLLTSFDFHCNFVFCVHKRRYSIGTISRNTVFNRIEQSHLNSQTESSIIFKNPAYIYLKSGIYRYILQERLFYCNF